MVFGLWPGCGGRPAFFDEGACILSKSTSAPRQRWLELDALAQQYLALPAGDSPAREDLRRRILRLLAAGWVQVTSEGEAQRDEDVLSRTFREQAVHLQRQHGNSLLAQAYGGLENLRDEGKAEFLARRASRAGKRQQTLLTGLLSGWDPARGDLRLFMQMAVRSFLGDMFRRCYGPTKLFTGGPGAAPVGLVTEGSGRQGEEDDEDDWLGAVAQQAGVVDPSDPEASAETKELLAFLAEARDALPAGLRAVYDSEIERHSDVASTDQQQAAALGLGSRNTLYKRRQELIASLRKLLAAAAPAGRPI